MKRLHLYLPGILTEPAALRAIEQQLGFPALRRLLARAARSRHPAAPSTDFLCEQWGVTAIAPLRAMADGLLAQEGYWLCADPVHLEMQPSRVLLHSGEECHADEAQQFCAALNAHFETEGLRFHAPHPARWYVHCAAGQDLHTIGLDEAVWQDAKTLPPQGRDALRWRKILTEVQMLLHAHPVNQQRATAGQHPINSLWLWGGGGASRPQPRMQGAGGDHELPGLLARAAGIPAATSLPQLLAEGGGLWVQAGAQRAWQRGDLPAWRDELERIERDVAAPLWQALCRGQVAEVWLDLPAQGVNQRFRLTRAARWLFWRAGQSLSIHCVE